MSTKRYCSLLTAHWLLPTTVGLAAFLLYLRTLAPTVTGEDAGELIAAAYLLGIPHPPGYPLFCVLGKLFTCLPVGDIAYRVNLMSAGFGALSVVILYLLIHHATRSRLSAVVGSLLFACSKEFWSQSLIAEVYTLNLFLLLLTLWWLVRYQETRHQRFLLRAAFTFGLSMTNHYMLMLLTLPGLLSIGVWGYGRMGGNDTSPPPHSHTPLSLPQRHLVEFPRVGGALTQ